MSVIPTLCSSVGGLTDTRCELLQEFHVCVIPNDGCFHSLCYSHGLSLFKNDISICNETQSNKTAKSRGRGMWQGHRHTGGTSVRWRKPVPSNEFECQSSKNKIKPCFFRPWNCGQGTVDPCSFVWPHCCLLNPCISIWIDSYLMLFKITQQWLTQYCVNFYKRKS